LLSAVDLAKKKGRKDWNSGLKNENKLNKFKAKVLSKVEVPTDVHKDIEEFPDVNTIIKALKLSKSEKLLINTVKRINNTDFKELRATNEVQTQDVFVMEDNIDTPKYVKVLQKQSKAFLKNVGSLMKTKEIQNSPFIALFKKPEYIGTITPENIMILNNMVYIAGIVKEKILLHLANGNQKSRDKMLRSLAWALINPDHRDNLNILNEVKNTLVDFACTIGKEKLMDTYKEVHVA